MRWSTAALTATTFAAPAGSVHAPSPIRRRLGALKYVPEGPNGQDPILEECQADCDNDEQCQPNLRCFQRRSNEPVPGCTGEDNSALDGEDFCYDPTKYPNQLLFVEPEDINKTVGLLRCQGDCKNKDNNCADGLKCFQRKKSVDPYADVPGCGGKGLPGMDYCIDPTTPSPSLSSSPTPYPSPGPTLNPTEFCPAPNVIIRVDLLTDSYPKENSWVVETSPGGVEVMSGNNFTEEDFLYTAEGCVSPGCYNFTIFDTMGDCMEGEHNVTYDDNTIVFGELGKVTYPINSNSTLIGVCPKSIFD